MPYSSAQDHAGAALPYRQIRAFYTADTITVYQAYNAEIAAATIAAGTFVSPPFKRGRTTWVKPSFLWMMYRAGWGTKDPNQARILAIELTRAGFEDALRTARLSHFDPAVHSDSKDAWEAANKGRIHPVVIQWDPERDVHGRALGWRSLQIGLRGTAVDKYVDEWIVGVRDVTETCARIKSLLDEGREQEAYAATPEEEVYGLEDELGRAIGLTISII